MNKRKNSNKMKMKMKMIKTLNKNDETNGINKPTNINKKKTT